MVDRTPQIVRLAIDLYEDLIEVPSPLRILSMPLNALLSDLRGKHWTKTVPPGTHRLVADIDPSFMKQVLDLPQRQRKADIHHHGQADNRRRCLELSERISHPRTLRDVPSALKQYCPDNAVSINVKAP